MNDSKYRYILYIIIIVIISTIVIQAYWNYKNYLSSKQQLINDVQVSLDKAVDDYYTQLAQETTLGFTLEGNAQKDVLDEGGFLERISKSIDQSHSAFKSLDSLEIDQMKGVTIIRGLQVDSMMNDDREKNNTLSHQEFKKRIKDIQTSDSLKIDISNFEMLTSKIVISISNDSLDISKIDSLLGKDLKRKRIDINYSLNFNEVKNDSSTNETHEYSENSDKLFLKTISKSSFLPKHSKLSIQYENVTWAVLNRMFLGILISTLLVFAVISCLFYLLKIIKHQKQIAEVKNDFISNITHEFKTPISTIGVALESIKNFNVIKDAEKTKSYIDMSNNQLIKLNVMVEKLLETASLDSESLQLKKEQYNVTDLVQNLVNKHALELKDKSLIFENSGDDIIAQIDTFHFENAINNIIDNAIKYGGDKIKVKLDRNSVGFIISVSDNGKALIKVNKEKIFEKFYRIPKGNTHDVKGFGIGLYYAKKIIEKHNGTIHLNLDNQLTTFKILIPNE